jgi:hypothetical protein
MVAHLGGRVVLRQNTAVLRQEEAVRHRSRSPSLQDAVVRRPDVSLRHKSMVVLPNSIVVRRNKNAAVLLSSMAALRSRSTAVLRNSTVRPHKAMVVARLKSTVAVAATRITRSTTTSVSG